MPQLRLPTLRDTAARNALAEQWIPLVGWVVKRMRLSRLTFPEAEAAGYDGLLRAAETFDESRRCRFNTYAVYWIKQAIRREEEYATLIHVPAHAQRPEYPRPKCRRKTTRPDRRVERRRLIVEAASRALCTPARLRPAAEDVWGDGPCPGGSPEPAAPEPPRDGYGADELLALERALRTLDERERQVIRGRFFEGRTLKEVGAAIGVTRERTRQIEQAALAKLRETLGATALA